MSPHVITPAAAYAAGIGPTSLRQVAAWNAEFAAAAKRQKPRDHATAERCGAHAVALANVAAEVERLAARKSRRRAA